MRIERNLMTGADGASTPVNTQESTLPREDVSFFSSQMEGSARPARATSTSPDSNILADAASLLNKSATGVGKGLRAYSKGDREKESSKYSSNLSDTMLLTSVLTKSVGKSVQFIEKISNLQ